MKEKGILMSGPMVVDIDEGRKTQTRRIITPQPEPDFDGPGMYNPAKADKRGNLYPGPEVFGVWDGDGEWGIKAPYAPGDRLYVREAYRLDEGFDKMKPSEVEVTFQGVLVKYEANKRIKRYATGKFEELEVLDFEAGRYRHARFMPKAFARIWFRVIDVRVEGLQKITEDEARKEGFESRLHFVEYWDKLNGPGSWDSNPWVWVIEFEKL